MQKRGGRSGRVAPFVVHAFAALIKPRWTALIACEFARDLTVLETVDMAAITGDSLLAMQHNKPLTDQDAQMFDAYIYATVIEIGHRYQAEIYRSAKKHREARWEELCAKDARKVASLNRLSLDIGGWEIRETSPTSTALVPSDAPMHQECATVAYLAAREARRAGRAPETGVIGDAGEAVIS